MLTYKELKEAEAMALNVSRRTGGAPMAILANDGPRQWWDFSGKSWRVAPHTHDIPVRQIIVGGICADMKVPL